MINRSGHYILTIEDFEKICKYFGVNARTVNVREFPSIPFIETRFYDIYTRRVLFSFYDHDGMIRIPINNDTSKIAYELSINQVLGRDKTTPPQEIIDAIRGNKHNGKTIPRK